MSVVARRDSGDYSDSQDIERNSTNDGPESDYDSAASDSEHSDQDPESQETERRVDDDEDRSNPQYIPKRGTFYEHDDRTAASGEEPSNATSETSSEKKEGSPPAERRRAPRKSEVIDRWSHDKYNESEQAPKSRDELVAIYGYDIRNEDAPPHARRNRRYGRGPNKYTRTWEDEEAYRRQAGTGATPNPRKPPNPEDFPDLQAANRHSRRVRGPRPRSKSQPTSNESLSNGTGTGTGTGTGSSLRRHASTKAKPKHNNNSNNNNKDKLPPIENLTITATLVNNTQTGSARKVSAVAQQRPVPTEQGKKKAPPQPMAPKSPAAVAAPASASASASAPAPAPAAAAAPALAQHKAPPAPSAQPPSGAEPRGSKRYSSLRQRPLAEPYSPQQPAPAPAPAPAPTPQQQQQQMRYHPEYASAAPPPHQSSPGPPLPQQLVHPTHRNTPPQHQPQHSQQVRHVNMVEPQPMLAAHAHHALHNMPPQPHTMAAPMPQPHPQPQPQPQGYAPPAMMPAQYMQQGGSGAVFGGGALYAAPQPYQHPHQLYPHHNYATTAGGVTYYSAAEQEPPPPPPQRTQRRPTAAIPIVRPDRPANSSEKDNIDRIVENMFVRKPWPGAGAQPSTDGTEDPDSRSGGKAAKEAPPPASTPTAAEPKERPEDAAETTKPEVTEAESIDA